MPTHNFRGSTEREWTIVRGGVTRGFGSSVDVKLLPPSSDTNTVSFCSRGIRMALCVHSMVVVYHCMKVPQFIII